MKKIEPIAFSSIEEINHWLVKNFDDYHETKEFLGENLYNLVDVEGRGIASVKYSAERLFCFYYESLKGLLILRNKDKDLKQVPGNHYDWALNKLQTISNEQAIYYLALQLLKGKLLPL